MGERIHSLSSAALCLACGGQRRKPRLSCVYRCGRDPGKGTEIGFSAESQDHGTPALPNTRGRLSSRVGSNGTEGPRVLNPQDFSSVQSQGCCFPHSECCVTWGLSHFSMSLCYSSDRGSWIACPTESHRLLSTYGCCEAEQW